MTTAVTDDRDRKRYEITEDGEQVGFVTYRTAAGADRPHPHRDRPGPRRPGSGRRPDPDGPRRRPGPGTGRAARTAPMSPSSSASTATSTSTWYPRTDAASSASPTERLRPRPDVRSRGDRPEAPARRGRRTGDVAGPAAVPARVAGAEGRGRHAGAGGVEPGPVRHQPAVAGHPHGRRRADLDGAPVRRPRHRRGRGAAGGRTRWPMPSRSTGRPGPPSTPWWPRPTDRTSRAGARRPSRR